MSVHQMNYYLIFVSYIAPQGINNSFIHLTSGGYLTHDDFHRLCFEKLQDDHQDVIIDRKKFYITGISQVNEEFYLKFISKVYS